MESLLGLVPFALLIVLCPLMMLFMHRGGHGGDDHKAASDDRSARQPNVSKEEVHP